jgi:acyl carrier protein
LTRARDTIRKQHPAIHGVVHSALVLRDQGIAGIGEQAFRASLSAKVDVSVNLDRVFGGDQLDFMLFFSSIASFLKAAGQSSYSAGCVFTDSFAHMLQQQRSFPVKVVNWGYWGTVGVAADEFHRQNMARLGLGSIQAQEGMAALEAFANSAMHQIALVKTVDKGTSVVATRTERADADQIRQIIIRNLCEELRIDAGMIRHDTPLADYGVDSIVGVNLVRGISEALQIRMEPSSLFDHRTVDQLTNYILANWRQETAAGVSRPAAEETGDQLLEEISCLEAPPADTYETVTF